MPHSSALEITRILTVLTAVVGLVSGSAARAERAFPDGYDTTRVVELEGAVLALRWTEPEVGIDLLARDGRVWIVTLGSISDLQRANIQRQTLAVGTELVIAGFAAIDGETDLYGTNALLSDRAEVVLRPGRERYWTRRR